MVNSSRDTLKKLELFSNICLRNDSFWLIFKLCEWQVKYMKPDCKVLLKAFEAISSIESKYYEEDFPEMLSVMYLLLKGYWSVNDDGVTEEVKAPPYTVISLLNAMRAITERIRNGTTIEEIINDQELCGDVEGI